MRLTGLSLVLVITVLLRPQGVYAQETILPGAAAIPAEAGYQYTDPPPIPPAPAESLYRLDALTSEPGDVRRYSLEEVLGMASQNNPTLRQAQLQISGELGKALEAGLYPNPVFSYEGEQIFLDVADDKDSPGEFQGGLIEQRFVTAGKLRLSREKYLRRAHIAEHLAVAQQFRVCNDVRIHFYQTLAAQEKFALRQELLKTSEDAAVTAQEAYNMGQARRPEVRRANVRLQQARLELMNAQNMVNEQFRTLTAIAGLPVTAGGVDGELATKCEKLSFEAALHRILSDSPELAAARAKLSADSVTVRRESVQWVPDVIVQGGPGYNFDTNETTAMASVSLEIPLFDRNQGTVQQAQADYARQRQELRRVELELQSRLAGVYQQYITALQHVEQYQNYILPELKAGYIELLESYKQNRVDWPDVLMAQEDYFDARMTQVDNLLVARTKEVLVYGFLLHKGLQAAPGVVPPGHIDSVPKPR